MEDFTLYANKNGVEWYRCSHCNYLTRGKPTVCPVCNGNGNLAESVEKSRINTDNVFENALQQLKDVMSKYGGKT